MEKVINILAKFFDVIKTLIVCWDIEKVPYAIYELTDNNQLEQGNTLQYDLNFIIR